MQILANEKIEAVVAETVWTPEFIAEIEREEAELITETDEPVDNIFSEKQQRLLTETLYNSWRPINPETGEPLKFVAAANVGIFPKLAQTPIIPDVLVSLDVELEADSIKTTQRAYFVWRFGKMPEVAIEIVSNTKGGEISRKKNRYAEIGIGYYVVFDPFQALSLLKLRVFELVNGGGKRYRELENFDLGELGLSLTLWRGEYEDFTEEWLRWCDKNGNLLLTGKEAVAREAENASIAQERAEYEAERADFQAERAEREAERADAAEAEIARLKAELNRLQNKAD